MIREMKGVREMRGMRDDERDDERDKERDNTEREREIRATPSRSLIRR